ncbi:Nucleoporin-62 C-terminal-like protein [Xylographa soralifera]|nr:Nucleoporin-62 C-terminal-like protein [Xylographa soralifera]
MSGPPKSSGPFSFGNTLTSGAGGAGGLFGTVTNNNSTGSSFGSGSTGQSSGIFGQGNASSSSASLSSFGGTPATSAPTTSLFGGSASTSEPAPLFGGGGSSGGNLFGATNKPSSFGLFSTPSKPSEAPNTGSVQNAGIFGGGPATSNANLFGNTGGTSSISSQPESSTPAAGKPGSAFSFGGVSTTPAGPPPAGSVAQGTAIGSGINFGNIGGATSQSTIPAITTLGSNTSTFGGAPQAKTSNLFGKPPTSSGSSSSGQNNSSSFNLSSQNTSLFGSTPTTSSGSLLGAMSPPMFPKSGILQGSDNQVSQAPSSSTFFFPTLGGQKPLGQFSAPSSSTSGVTFNLPAFSSAQSSTPAAPGGTTSSASNLFGSMGGAPISSPISTGPSSSSVAPTSTTASTSTGLFGASNAPLGGVNKPPEGASSALGNGNCSSAAEAPSATNQPSGNPAAAATGSDTNRLNTNLGTSTSGPRPPAQSRLKNKSMDEIITRWASDLSKYQKEFQRQAMKVSEWDRMLVDNSEKIQKLYGSTLEAERATVEVERQLSVVENDQGELEYWLDHYERQVDELIATQIGQGDTIQGPDQERERTYKLAEKLADRLNEMGKDLTSMIENINDASSNLSKNGKSDDALSQIVRVLNGHLSQLQQIDQGAAVLQAKVLEAQKASRTAAPMNGMSGIRNDAADDFYRSYMGRR